MASLGDIGRVVPALGEIAGNQLFGAGVYPGGNTLTISGLPALALVLLMTDTARFVTAHKASTAGVVTYYDLPDGTWFLYEVGTANAWRIVMASGVGSVTQLSGAAGTVAFAWIGG